MREWKEHWKGCDPGLAATDNKEKRCRQLTAGEVFLVDCRRPGPVEVCGIDSRRFSAGEVCWIDPQTFYLFKI